jgi:hypothetical protein
MMSTHKFMMPPDTITTRIDGWVGSPGHIPARVAELMARAMPMPGDESVAEIRARMLARHREVIGYE